MDKNILAASKITPSELNLTKDDTNKCLDKYQMHHFEILEKGK